MTEPESRMTISYFVYFEDDPAHPELRVSDRHGILEVLRHTPRLLMGHLFTPTTAGSPFINNDPLPRLALQLRFADLHDLEAAVSPQGHLQQLAAPDAWPSLAGTVVSQQAMATRPFLVPDLKPATEPSELSCSYLVRYPGQAEDLNAWPRHYLNHHPQLMSRFPIGSAPSKSSPGSTG